MVGKKYWGTAGIDLFSLGLVDLANATIVGGLGDDTLAIAETGAYTFSSASYRSLSGVDAFDFSAHQSGSLNVLLTSSMMAQTDNARLTIMSGAAGIDDLRAGSSVGGTIVVAGTGTVRLDNATNNVVTVQGGASVHVLGGLGNDVITAGAGGATLDGGAGNDTLNAGQGADRIVFGGGYGRDTVNGFDVAQDRIALVGQPFAYMSQVLLHVHDTPAGAVLDLGGGTTLTLNGVAKSALSAANFEGVVAGAPTYFIGTGVTAAELNALLASAGDGATFILGDGLHVFDQPIRVTHDHVSIRGESEAGTIVRFAFAAGSEADGFIVDGGASTALGTIAGDIAAGQNYLTLASTAGLAAGDTLYVSQANDAAYMAANGWTNVSAADAAAHPFREADVVIDHIDGNTVYLTHAIAYAMTVGVATVARTSLVSGVSLADFTIDSGLGAANANDFANLLPGYLNLAQIRLQGTIGASLRDISILNPQSLGFDIFQSVDLSADSLTVRGAWNKGSDGNGYGLQIGQTFNSTFTNLDITDTRHAVLFSGWDSEAFNIVQVTNTNRDINFHGGPDFGNVVTVTTDVMSYDPSQNTGVDRGYWPIVGDNVTTHANIDPYAANVVKFHVAVASDANDCFYGTDDGAWLDGGNGNDTIVGGLGDDTLTGGAGADVFVIAAAAGHDVITDFDAMSSQHDTLQLAAGLFASWADFAAAATDTGAGLVVGLGSQGNLTLAGVTKAQLSGGVVSFV